MWPTGDEPVEHKRPCRHPVVRDCCQDGASRSKASEQRNMKDIPASLLRQNGAPRTKAPGQRSGCLTPDAVPGLRPCLASSQGRACVQEHPTSAPAACGSRLRVAVRHAAFKYTRAAERLLDPKRGSDTPASPRRPAIRCEGRGQPELSPWRIHQGDGALRPLGQIGPIALRCLVAFRAWLP